MTVHATGKIPPYPWVTLAAELTQDEALRWKRHAEAEAPGYEVRAEELPEGWIVMVRRKT